MDRTFAQLSLVAAILFLVIVLALMFLAPEVDALKYGISFYALTDFSAVIGVAIALVCLSAMFLGIALWPHVSVAGRVGTALLIGWGMLSMPASIFPLDPPGAVPTLSGTIHNMAGLTFLLAIPAVLLVEFSENVFTRSTGASKATYWLAPLVPVSAIFLFASNGPFSSLGIGGLIQRLYWLVFTAWLICKAQQLLPKLSRPSAHSTPWMSMHGTFQRSPLHRAGTVRSSDSHAAANPALEPTPALDDPASRGAAQRETSDGFTDIGAPVDAYREDLVYIHDVGHGAIARDAAGRLITELAVAHHWSGTVVDLGCGSGILAGALVEAGYRVVGIDISDAMVALARARAPRAEFQVGSFVFVDLPTCVAVTAVGEVVNYAFDPANGEAALADLVGRAYEALVPDGILLFDVAGPSRAESGESDRTHATGPDWAVLIETAVEPGTRVLRRHITSFRQVGNLYRRDDEVHRLVLHETEAVLAPMRAAGFEAEVLSQYRAVSLPRGVVAFLGRKPVPHAVGHLTPTARATHDNARRGLR